ncbi:MAG: flagellar assembly protein FliW [Negativicutes bacterium]|nr:flagellar assembly protein FliW [Negativicutes bacterium]
MKLATTRFGEIEAAEEQILTFESGLPGFPDERQFALLPYDDGPFVLLQAVANPDLTFVAVDPFRFFPDYEFKLDEAFVSALKLSEQSPPLVYCLVTIPENVQNMTANLLAPILINPLTKQAAQVVLEKRDYTTRHRLFPATMPQPAKEAK